MEPPQLVNLAAIPKVNRKRDKDEALKRQTEWVAPRRGRQMTCSTCGVPGHSARGCQKFNQISDEGEGTSKTGQIKSNKQKMDQIMGESTSKDGQFKSKKQKMDKQCKKGKNQTKERHMTLIDEDDVESSPPRSPNAATVEDFPLTAPQPSQDYASSQSQSLEQSTFSKSFLHSMVDPSPSNPDFEDFGLEVEEDISWKPRGISEFKSRIQQRQKQAQPTGSRQINFLGADRGLSKPSDLYAPKGLTWKGNASATGRMLEQLRVEKMDKQCKKGKNQTKERHRTLIDEDVESSPPKSPNVATMEDFPLTTPQPSQDSLVLKLRKTYPGSQEVFQSLSLESYNDRNKHNLLE